MNPLDKLILATTVGRNIYGKWKFHQILGAVLGLVVLTIVAAFLVGVFVVGACYASYFYLVQLGYPVLTSLFITGCGIFLIVVALLYEIRRRSVQLKSQARTPLGEAADAFLEGLMAR